MQIAFKHFRFFFWPPEHRIQSAGLPRLIFRASMHDRGSLGDVLRTAFDANLAIGEIIVNGVSGSQVACEL